MNKTFSSLLNPSIDSLYIGSMHAIILFTYYINIIYYIMYLFDAREINPFASETIRKKKHPLGSGKALFSTQDGFDKMDS